MEVVYASKIEWNLCHIYDERMFQFAAGFWQK